MTLVPNARRGSPAPYASEPVHGLPARRAAPHEPVAPPRLPPRPRRDRLPDRRELPPPARPPRVPPRPPELPPDDDRIRPRRLLRCELPPEPRGPLRGDRVHDPRPRPLPDPDRPREGPATGPVRLSSPRGRPRVRDRRDPGRPLLPRPRGGDRREPRRGRRDGWPHRRLRADPRGLPPLPLLHAPARGDREAPKVRVPEVAHLRRGERVRQPRDRGLLPGPRGGEPEHGRVHDRPRREDDPRPRPR